MRRKIVLLGDSAVGKTSLIRRFVFDMFDDDYIVTIGSKVTRKDLLLPRPDGTTQLTLMVWDLLGREGYKAVHARAFAGAHGALLVSDLTREETLVSLERYWIPSLLRVVERVPLVFVGNKADLEGSEEFGKDDLEALAARHGAGDGGNAPAGTAAAHLTSARTGRGVEAAFEALGHRILAQPRRPDPVKELYQRLVASGVRRRVDTRTPIGALDALLLDFGEGFEDERLAMVILRQEITRAGIDVRSPTREGLRRAVDYLAEAESEFRDRDAVVRSRERRLAWVLSLPPD